MCGHEPLIPREYSHGFATRCASLTAAPRDYDPYEVNGSNDSFGTATDVGNLADDFTLISDGFLKYRQFDLDYYRIEIGAGRLTVRTFGAEHRYHSL